MNRIVGVVGGVLVLALVAGGCSGKKKGGEGTGGGANACDQPRKEVRLAISSLPNTLDWSASNESSAQNYPVILAMMRGLTRLDDAHQPVPDLAEKWEIATDKDRHQVYTFHLRKDVVWSDGKTPLRAKDFVFGWRRAIQGNEPAELADIVGGDAVIQARERKELAPADREAAVKKALDNFGVVAVDDHTLKVTLKSPRSYFLTRIAYVYTYFPAPSQELEALEGKGDQAIRAYFNQPRDGRPLVLGAYRLETWDQVGQKVVLTKNPHGPLAAEARAVEKLELVQAELSPLLYDQCKVDFVFMDDPAALSGSMAGVSRKPLLSTYFLVFNTSKVTPPLRKAIAMALDRPALMKGLLPEVRPAVTFLPPDLPGAIAADDPLAASFPKLDREAAKKAVAEAGYKGEPLTLMVRAKGTFLPEVGIAEAVKAQLATIGVNVTIQPSANLTNDIRAADGTTRVHMYMRRLGADYAHPQTFFTLFQARGNHYSEYDKLDGGKVLAEVEKLLEEGAAETEPAKMRAAYARAQELLQAKQTMIVPIFYPDRYFRTRPWLEGIGVDPFNFLTFRTMRVKQ